MDRLEAAPGVTVRQDVLAGIVYARRGRRGPAWALAFDNGGRFHLAWRTDLAPGVVGVSVRTLREVLTSLGVAS